MTDSLIIRSFYLNNISLLLRSCGNCGKGGLGVGASNFFQRKTVWKKLKEWMFFHTPQASYRSSGHFSTGYQQSCGKFLVEKCGKPG